MVRRKKSGLERRTWRVLVHAKFKQTTPISELGN
jgi:hypothetical protein